MRHCTSTKLWRSTWRNICPPVRIRKSENGSRFGAGPISTLQFPDGSGPMICTKEERLSQLREVVASGRPIIGAGAGTGISAKCAEAGGADLIVIYNSGRFRMAGPGSPAGPLPYGDSNAIVMEMAGEGLPVVHHTPVLAGVCGTDPFRPMGDFLRDVEAAGF